MVIGEDIPWPLVHRVAGIPETGTALDYLVAHLLICPVYAVVVDEWLTIALALGFGARLTRLITLDTITQPIRNHLKGLLAALIECPWCSGVWVAVPVGLSWLWWADQTWWQVTALIGTIAWVAGALAGVGTPRQVEVATVSPVALINADEPATDTVDLTEAEVNRISEQVLKHLNRSTPDVEGDGAGGAH